jgi:hypothetical protein
MIRDFVQWTASFGETGDLEELHSCRVGIEAAEYLSQRILKHPRAREPLIPALGGLPLALEQHIQDDLNTFRSLGIEPWFVFSGLDITKQDSPFAQKASQATVNRDAWNLYDNHEAEASVAKFGESSTMQRPGTAVTLLTGCSIRNTRRSLSRAAVHPHQAECSLDCCTIQRLGSGKRKITRKAAATDHM